MKFDFKNRFLKKSLDKNDIIIFGRLSKFRNWELQIDKIFAKPTYIAFSSCVFKRLFGDLFYQFEINLGDFFWGCFTINDTRVWDEYTDRPIPYEEYKKLPRKRKGKPKFKFRKQGKEKWYYSSKFLKLFNLDFLNDPCGITIDFTWFSFPLYTSLQIGNHPNHQFCFSLDIGKTQVGFICKYEICLFGYFAQFEFGQNTILRNANLKYVEDFQRLTANGTNLYIEKVLAKQIERKNLDYVKAIVNYCNIFKYTEKSDKVLIIASFKGFFKKDIFDFIVKNVEYFNSWDEIELDYIFFEPYAVEKLKVLHTNYHKSTFS